MYRGVDDVINYAKGVNIQSAEAKIEQVIPSKTEEQPRSVAYEQGDSIGVDVLEQLEQIEREFCQQQNNPEEVAVDLYDIRSMCEKMGDSLRVLHKENWYCAYSVDSSKVTVHRFAHGVPRDETEKDQVKSEMKHFFEMMLKCSMKEEKPIKMECDTLSYIVEALKEKGMLEQIEAEDGSAIFKLTELCKAQLKNQKVPERMNPKPGAVEF